MTSTDIKNALKKGRPPNVVQLFPNSRALIVSGKVIDRAMLEKKNAIAMAANGRSSFVIRGVLRAAQKANAAIIIEIARSEGGMNAYCPISMWNLARMVDAYCNEMNITIPVAIHTDHYVIKNNIDHQTAKTEIPSLFDAGVTSIAVDASHLPDDDNLLTNIDLNSLIPKWAGLETEVGEIKGKSGLSSKEEALFLIQGLNAHNIFPEWIALNNGSVHGIEENDSGIQVALTAQIHEALAPYSISGAQHGTSGNSSQRLREIADKTRTTKANVATALQMVSWGVDVNDDGNACLNEKGHPVKKPDVGVLDSTWAAMIAYAESNNIKKNDFKKLNLPFENTLLAQPKAVRDRMVAAVEDFAYNMIVNVFQAGDTADNAIEIINQAQSYDIGTKAMQIESSEQWTPEKIRERAKLLSTDKGVDGNFDD
ncbi:MAG: class II fructose-bisphosphate aldolase [Candidatus Magnetomorum sp.]|nr:class II fructose-bisphosphate aldolase [Candidatus Magnetomorum sp.]